MDNTSKILLYLAKHSEKVFTMHQLSGLTKIPYATLYRTIDKMGLLITKNIVGRAVTIQLNKEADMASYYLTIASDKEVEEFTKNKPLFKLIREECRQCDYSIVLFGSQVKDTATKRSDVDLLVIRKDTKKEPAFKKYEILFHKQINPIYIKKDEFQHMLKDKEENVGKQALKNHIILSNPALFWKMVKKTWDKQNLL